ncbi:MAG: hypothetical protein A2X94_06045 [Bdellovibrionales bacterium GWB1_55_8]|nr:MAG: hypothetical protein A2X94_06045 [Bdellovibrionales bacterium GWB1_55_8]
MSFERANRTVRTARNVITAISGASAIERLTRTALLPAVLVIGGGAVAGVAAGAVSALTGVSPAFAQTMDVTIDRVENGTLYFASTGGAKAPSPIRTDLVDLLPVGTLKGPATELPYFVLTGFPCRDCKDSPNVFIIRPDGRKPTAFIYPGKIIDQKTGSLLLSSRAFFGRCLWSQRNDVFVVFQQERVDRRRSLQSSVFIAEPGQDHLDERLLERRLPRITDTLKLVKQKVCQEISGKNRNTLLKLLDLRPKRDPEVNADDAGAPSGTEDEDLPPKENQTDQDLSRPRSDP